MCLSLDQVGRYCSLDVLFNKVDFVVTHKQAVMNFVDFGPLCFWCMRDEENRLVLSQMRVAKQREEH